MDVLDRLTRGITPFLLITLATPLTTAIGAGLGLGWLLPGLEALPAYALMVVALRQGRRSRAVAVMIWWALCLALSGVCLTMLWPERAEAVILNATAYRDEMRAWLSTGTGREATPSLFIPQHVLHAAVFAGLTLLSGGCLSIIMGAALMGYMSFFVGDLLLQCQGTAAWPVAILLAWNPWSMVRIVSFIILGVTLAEPLLSRLPGSWPEQQGRGRWIAAAVAGLLVDILMKAVLAPVWPALLAGCLSSATR